MSESMSLAKLDLTTLAAILGRVGVALVSVFGLNEGLKLFAHYQSAAKYRIAAAARRADVRANTEAMLAARRADPKGNEALAKIIEAKSSFDVLNELKNGTLTSTSVLKALQHRAAEANVELNFMCGFFDQAAVAAKQLDQQAQGSRGPLHGCPISIKECCGVEGQVTTIGLAKLATNVIKEDGVLIQVLKAAGGVPFCHTNIPQTMLSYECTNPVYGATTNPHDPRRGPGGSSGGEGSIIGAGGSIMGIGTDIGGSVRIPAHFCGVCGFKPSVGRLSGKGTVSGEATAIAIAHPIEPCVCV
jgi:Asp-tRNA(Asn)/Glu-tRNA(Gln) amidotransferase A subunit family amidase